MRKQSIDPGFHRLTTKYDLGCTFLLEASLRKPNIIRLAENLQIGDIIRGGSSLLNCYGDAYINGVTTNQGKVLQYQVICYGTEECLYCTPEEIEKRWDMVYRTMFGPKISEVVDHEVLT